jgi:hypothetical protein
VLWSQDLIGCVLSFLQLAEDSVNEAIADARHKDGGAVMEE